MNRGTFFLSHAAASWLSVATAVTACAEPAYVPPPPEYYAQKIINDQHMAAMKGVIDEMCQLNLPLEAKKRFIFLLATELDVELGILPYSQMKQVQYIIGNNLNLKLPPFTYKTRDLEQAARTYPDFVNRGHQAARTNALNF